MIACFQPVGLGQISARFLAAVVVNEQIQQPEVRPALGRVTGDEILVKLDGSVMIGVIPVREDAAFRLEQRRVGGLVILGQQTDGLAGQRRGQLPVFPGALAV